MAFSYILFGTIGSTLTCLILLAFAVFLILLVLVQRGKGGGLSGAFGGMGGQSAFGTKAGDTFTRITVVTATLWIIFCIVSAKYLGVSSGDRFAKAASGAATTNPIPIDTGTGVGTLGGDDGSLGGSSLGNDATGDSSSSDSSSSVTTAGGAVSDDSSNDDPSGESESPPKTDGI